jgi:hypothetical protein
MAVLRAKDESRAEALIRRLDVRRRARADAAIGRPPPDQQALCDAERDIAGYAETERRRLNDRRATVRGDAERAMRAALPVAEDIGAPLAQARLALAQAEGRLAHDYAAARAQAARADADLAAFRAEHGLRRDAQFPDSTLLQAGLLLAAAVFESLFSAALFAETEERGLLGGAIIAIGLSGANVALGFLGGYLVLRYLQHRSRLMKALGGAGFALSALLALILNLFAALWRQSILAPTEFAAPSAGGLGARIGEFFATSLTLTSPQAVVLLMLGGGVWVFAALKGYGGFDDPYPEFGAMARAARDTAETQSALRDEAGDALAAPIEAASADIDAAIAAQAGPCARLAAIYDGAAAELVRIDAEERRIEEAARAAIDLYRAENTAARSGPPPAYFAQSPTLSGPREDALAACGAWLKEAREALAQARKAADQNRAALARELEGARARLDAAGPA